MNLYYRYLFLALTSVSLFSGCGDDDKKSSDQPAPVPTDARDSKEVRTEDRPSALALTPNGDTVIAGLRNGKVTVTNVAQPGEIKSSNRHKEEVTKVVVLGDGKQFLSASLDKTARLWNTTDVAEVRAFYSEDPFSDISLSADGQHFASAHESGYVRIWNISTGKAEKAIRLGPSAVSPAHREDPALSLDFSNDGNLVVVGTLHGVRLFRVSDSNEVRSFSWDENVTLTNVRAVNFSRDGKHVLAVNDNKEVYVWNAETGEKVQRFVRTEVDPSATEEWNIVGTPMFSQNNDKVIAVVGDTIRVWNIADRAEVRRIATNLLESTESTPLEIAISESGEAVALGFENNSVQVFDVDKQATALRQP